MKKILTLIGLMIIVACSVMAMTSCENTDWGEGDGDPSLLEYKLSEDGTYYSVAGIGDYVGTHLVIPEEYNGLPIKEISHRTFAISNNEEAQRSNESVRTLKIVTVSNSITNIYGEAFYNSNIKRINIGSGVCNIDWDSFFGAANLKKITVHKNNQNYMSRDGVLYSKDMTKLIKYPEKKVARYFSIPDKVETIYPCAFENTMNLKRIKIGKNVTKIEAAAFFNSGIKSVKLSDSVEEMGLSVFASCQKLKKLELGAGITEIPETGFSSCNLRWVIIPQNVKRISEWAFSHNGNLDKVFYEGDETEWESVKVKEIGPADDETNFTEKVYFYSKDKPSNEGNFWRYVFGVPTVWKN